MQVVYIPIGVPTFDLKVAQDQFEKSISLIKGIAKDDVRVPEKMLLSIGDLQSYLETVNPSLIILQNITFANSAYTMEVMRAFPNTPLLLWTLKEPIIDGGRLRLNSLTGAFSAANQMNNLGKYDFDYVFGSPEDDEVRHSIESNVRAVKTLLELKKAKALAIGHTPEGFGFGRALDSELLKNFGVRLTSIEARELIEMAKSYDLEDCKEYLTLLKEKTVGYENIAPKNIEDFIKLFKAYDFYCKKNGISIIASRCWPDFFTSYGTPVCAVLSLLNDMGVTSACESDVYGALSMFILNKLTGSSCFFGDPVSMDEKENTITFWHCGMCAPSLATCASLGVHPNRKLGPVMDFGCKESDSVTVFRIGRNEDGTFRAFITTGKALDKTKQFQGASVIVETDDSAKTIIEDSVRDGWEPHFAVCYADVVSELEVLCRLLNIDVYQY